MKMVPDDDVVRGLGFVSLFSGHLEAQINHVLELFGVREEFLPEERARPISQRIAKAERLAKELQSVRKQELLGALDSARTLFARRNELLHSSITSAPYGKEGIYRHSAFPEIRPLRVSAETMYQLATEIQRCQFEMDRPLFAITKELAGIVQNDA